LLQSESVFFPGFFEERKNNTVTKNGELSFHFSLGLSIAINAGMGGLSTTVYRI
jgi:hypothetical protein